MEINHWEGVLAVFLGVVSFFGMTYVVIALNTGWRFAYWISSACFGAVMVLLSIFWLVLPVGPIGHEPRWIPIAAGEDIQQAAFEGEQQPTIPQYPGGPWQEAEEGDPRIDEFGSSVANCLTADPENLEHPDEQQACEAAQELMPAAEDIPVIDGTAVAVTPQVTDIRFADDHGQVAQATVTPVTTDPRVTDDPEGAPLAGSFRIAGILDEGSLRVPAYGSLFIFVLYTSFHLWGLNRAERRKLSPAAL